MDKMANFLKQIMIIVDFKLFCAYFSFEKLPLHVATLTAKVKNKFLWSMTFVRAEFSNLNFWMNDICSECSCCHGSQWSLPTTATNHNAPGLSFSPKSLFVNVILRNILLTLMIFIQNTVWCQRIVFLVGWWSCWNLDVFWLTLSTLGNIYLIILASFDKLASFVLSVSSNIYFLFMLLGYPMAVPRLSKAFLAYSRSFLTNSPLFSTKNHTRTFSLMSHCWTLKHTVLFLFFHQIQKKWLLQLKETQERNLLQCTNENTSIRFCTSIFFIAMPTALGWAGVGENSLVVAAP